MKSFRKLALAGAAVAAAISAVPAQAVTFELINLGGAEEGTDARLGFQAAANFWSSVLTNNSTVKLNIGFSPLGSGILGQTGSNRADVTLAHVMNGLATTGNSALDGIAVGNLFPKISPSGSIGAITNAPAVGILGVNTNPALLQWDNDGSENNSYIWGNTAVLKAMGITTNDYYGGDFSNDVDGQVTFSSTFAFDFNPTNGIAAGKYDFIGVAIHEIGHALGFVSGVDLYDVDGFPNGPARTQGGFDFDNPGGGLMSTLDLFRYSNDVRNVVPGTGAVLDWSVTRPSTATLGGTPFFSIDGTNQLFGNSQFSSGAYNGDGRQASHWKAPGTCTNFLGVMNPYLCSASESEVTALDLAAFDAMGWNINFDVLANPNYVATSSQAYLSAIPEPATWGMMLMGFGLAGAAMRRRKPQVSVTYA